MTSFQSQPANVDAEQWVGDAASLAAIQKLIFPASPLLGRKALAVQPDNMHLGIMADVSGLIRQELIHMKINDWVVVYPSGAIKVVGEKEFEEMFRPAPTPTMIGDRHACADRPSLADA